MKRSPRASALLVALIGAFAIGLAACTADVAPTAPPAAPAVSQAPAVPAATEPPSDLLGIDVGDVLTDLLSKVRLFECSTPDFGSVTQSIGPAGGDIKIGPHSLVIPAGALDRTVAITASTKSGDHVRVDFEPHGLRFRSAATLRLSYAHCPRAPFLPAVAYVDGLVGEVLSVLEVLPALNDQSSDRVTTRLRHFSGYAIAD